MTGYNDPKVTKPVATSSGMGNKAWIAAAVVVVLLVLGWVLGLFGGAADMTPAPDSAVDAPATTAPVDGGATVDPATPAAPAD